MGQIKRKKRKPFTLDTVAVGTGANCPKCGRPMQGRRHVDGFIPPPGMRYWYAWWDFCRSCRHLQHYDDAKQYDVPKGEEIGCADPADALNGELRARLDVDETTTLPTDPVAIGLLLRQLYRPEERAQIIEGLR